MHVGRARENAMVRTVDFLKVNDVKCWMMVNRVWEIGGDR